MNILFALHQSLACNSASHVDGLARELSKLGHECVVALPENLDDADRFAPMPYQIATFQQILQQPRRFANQSGPDVFHAWTPRKIIYQFHERLAEDQSFCTVIHLEDNEEHIARVAMGDANYRAARQGRLPFPYPEHLTSPIQAPRFFSQASGVTLLIDRLAECIPIDRPHQVFWPAVDQEIFHPRPQNMTLRAAHGIAPNDIVICYHGNMHHANHAEIRSLYLAVALLNRIGLRARLVRMGQDYVGLEPEYRRWTADFTIELGYIVDRRKLADVLAMADIFVQPGTSNKFNDYRFPSKLPEFFALGRPVILPKANIGHVTRHLQDAFVLEDANGQSICEAVKTICSDKQTFETLSAGASAFAKNRFSWQESAAAVARFYESITHDSPTGALRTER